MDENPIDFAAEREHILDYLRDGPYRKRAVVEKIGCSRSTVDRAIRTLQDADLVRERDEGYEATLAGVLALKQCRRYDRAGRALDATASALRPVWKEAPITMAALRGADVSVFERSSIGSSLDRLADALAGADTVQAMLPALSNTDTIATIQERTIEAGVPVTLVCSPTVFELLCREYPVQLRESVTAGETTVLTTDLPDFSVWVLEQFDHRQVFIVIYDDGTPHALLSNDTQAAADWAERCIDNFRADANDRQEDIESLVPNADASTATAPDTAGGAGTATAAATPNGAGVEERSDLLGGSFSVDHNRLRTPEFGTEGACTVLLWFNADWVDNEWQTLVKWDYLTVGYRRGKLFGHVFDPDAERLRARTDVPVDNVRAGEWHHVGYSYDEETARLYLDGELVDETADSYPLHIRPLGACLGYIYRHRDTGVHTPDFSGQIVDARFYETALDEESVATLYRATAPDRASLDIPESG